MATAITRPGPPPWQTCEVCKAAHALIKATDNLRTFVQLGGVLEEKADPRKEAVKVARETWAYAKGTRHTGAVHTPEVAP